MNDTGSEEARITGYVAGLPEASGEFTGTYDPDTAVALAGWLLGEFPVDINIGGVPCPAAWFMTELRIRITPDGDEYKLPVVRTEVDLRTGRVRAWCRRPQLQEGL